MGVPAEKEGPPLKGEGAETPLPTMMHISFTWSNVVSITNGRVSLISINVDIRVEYIQKHPETFKRGFAQIPNVITEQDVNTKPNMLIRRGCMASCFGQNSFPLFDVIKS